MDGTPLTQPTGGVRRYVEELSKALSRCFPEDQYYLVSDQPFEGRSGRGPNSPAERRWWLWGLRREMGRLGAELFHGTDFSVPYVPSTPSVMTLHDLSPWRPESAAETSDRVRHRTPVLLRLGLASMIITPSEAVRREAITRFSLDASSIVPIPLASSICFHPVQTAPKSRPYFLYVGTIEQRKNLGVIFDAWREIQKSEDVDLVLAGRMRNEKQVLPDGVEHRSEVEDAELPALYSGAAAFVYPSLYEGFGLPVLEAMQCGAMVITSKDAAISEVASGAAIQVDARDTAGWIEAMRSALSTETRLTWSERGLRRAAEYSWERTATRTREVYLEALRRS
jgi:glycosyltransferase involved in cell wall biosynthesis